MSLQVWLPLNGNMNNQGLSDAKFSHNNPTYATGKVTSKSLSINNTSSKTTTVSELEGLGAFSVALWYNPISSSTAYSQFSRIICFQVKNKSGSVGDFRLETVYTDGTYLNWYGNGFMTDSGGSATHTNLKQNTWYHLVLVFDGNIFKGYINGKLASNYTILSQYKDNATLTGNVTLGGGGMYGCINDVRIYDHCLSLKEISELSKGITLHYPLADQYVQPINNCYNYPTFNTSNSNGGWSHWGASGCTGGYSQNTDKTFIFNKNNTYSHKVYCDASSTGSGYLLYQELLFDGGARSLNAIIKASDSSPITASICWPCWNGHVSSDKINNQWTSIIDLGGGFYWCKCEGFHQVTNPSSANAHLTGIYVVPGKTIYVSEMYLENYRETCSQPFWGFSGIISDTSGSGNDTVVTASTCPVYSVTPPPKYNGCYIFDTSAKYITVPITTAGFKDSYTVSYWANLASMTGKMAWGFSNGNRLNIYPTNGVFCLNTGDSANNPFKNNGTSVSFSPYENAWHHYALTGDGTTAKLYIDGKLVGTATTYKSMTGTQIYISGWNANSEYKWVGGQISDFRIYATALTADDIKDLYSAPFSITNNGTLLIQGEVVES